MIDLNDASPQSGRHVQWRAIKEAVKGRETEILDAFGIDWQSPGHVTCPYPGHDDHNPSWRWDQAAAKARCSSLSPWTRISPAAGIYAVG